MIKIDYPTPSFQVRKKQDQEFIFDTLRKKWLLLTPEEWVRQNFIQYLVQVKRYPSTLIAQEKEMKLGELTKRFDVLIYDANHAPWMMIECKEEKVRLDEKVLHQVLRYNMSIPVQYIVITNGPFTYAWEKQQQQLVLLHALPDFT